MTKREDWQETARVTHALDQGTARANEMLDELIRTTPDDFEVAWVGKCLEESLGHFQASVLLAIAIKRLAAHD